MVGGSRHHDRARAVLRTEDALDEFFHLTTALADQSDDNHFRARVAGHHAEENALADAAAREQADALAAAHGEHRVDSSNADIERLGNRLTRQRVDRFAGQPYPILAIERSEVVQGV